MKLSDTFLFKRARLTGPSFQLHVVNVKVDLQLQDSVTIQSPLLLVE